MIGHLKRYSKPRGPGDQTSGGLGKLLNAQSELSRIDVLVRETLQNSWDAADLDNWFPAYGINIRKSGRTVTTILREVVFTGISEELRLERLEASLASDELHVVEIFDRGTTGLTGPVRSDEAVEEDAPNNFNAFVFDIGSTKPLGSSGGTYGFGKTAAFEASNAHAVVYWTRCDRGDGELEDRVIASALHGGFAIDGKRYTGAHWWGDPDVEDIVPLRGQAATELGEALFETHFGQEETGTSILVIDPTVLVTTEADIDTRASVRDESHVVALGQQMLNALVTNAWPKVVPHADGNAPMVVQFTVNGEDSDVASIVSQRYPVFARGLSSIRVAQSGEDLATVWPVPEGIRSEKVVPIRLAPRITAEHSLKDYFGDRQDRVSGHLYIAKVLQDPLKGDLEGRNEDSLSLMRSATEIVVEYIPMSDDQNDMYEWFGVFKPTPECDHHFARSEPSTHDAWNISIPDNPVSVYVVDRTLQNVAAKVREAVRGNSTRALREESRSARQLSRALNSFVPSCEMDLAPRLLSADARGSSPDVADLQEGPGAQNSGDGKQGTRKGQRGKVAIDSARQLSDGSWALDFTVLADDASTHRVEAIVKAKEWGGAMALGEESVDVEWAMNDTRQSGHVIKVRGSQAGVLTIRPKFDAAITVDLKLEREG